MLGKLMKHEWRAVWKVPTLLIGILLIVSVVTGCSFAMSMWQSNWVGVGLSMLFLVSLYYMVIIVCSVGITVYLAVRFYKSMFTDEGYLTHTLPVTSHQLLLSKVITMSLWNLISVAGVALSISILVGCAYVFWMHNLGEIGNMFRSIMRGMAEMTGLGGMLKWVCTGLFMSLASAFSGTMTVVGSICIGQMLRKHRILGAIGAYFGIMMIAQILSVIVMWPMMFRMAMTMSSEEMLFSTMLVLYWVIGLLVIGVGVGLYFLSEYLIRRQLDLE